VRGTERAPERGTSKESGQRGGREELQILSLQFLQVTGENEIPRIQVKLALTRFALQYNRNGEGTKAVGGKKEWAEGTKERNKKSERSCRKTDRSYLYREMT